MPDIFRNYLEKFILMSWLSIFVWRGVFFQVFFFLIQVLVKQGVCGNIFRLKSVASNAFQTTTDIGIIVQPMLQPRTKPVEKQPRSSYPVLLKITRELYTLGFRPKQRWIGDVEGAFFFCLEEMVVWRKI